MAVAIDVGLGSGEEARGWFLMDVSSGEWEDEDTTRMCVHLERERGSEGERVDEEESKKEDGKRKGARRE